MPLNKEAVQAVKESVQEAVDAVVKYWLQHKSPSNLVTKEHDILVLAVAQATAVATQTAFNYRDARGNLQSPSDVLETLIMLEVGRALLPVTMEFSATEIDRLHKTLFIISVKSTVLSAVVSALFEEIAFFHRDSSPSSAQIYPDYSDQSFENGSRSDEQKYFEANYQEVIVAGTDTSERKVKRNKIALNDNVAVQSRNRIEDYDDYPQDLSAYTRVSGDNARSIEQSAEISCQHHRDSFYPCSTTKEETNNPRNYHQLHVTEPCLNSNRCVASNTGPIAVKFDQHAPNSDEEIKRQVINNSALKDAVYQDNRRSLASNPSKLLNEITEQEPIRKFGNTRAFFNEQMDERLREGVRISGGTLNWTAIAKYVGHGLTGDQCRKRYSGYASPDMIVRKKGPWSTEEELQMQQLIGRYGIYSSQRFRNLIENEEIHVKISDGSQATSCGRCDDVTCADFVMSSKSAIRNFVDKNESEFASSSDGIFSNISSEENKEWLRRGLRWTEIARIMNRGYRECIDRWRAIQRSKLNVGTFTQEEDELILKKVSEWDGHIRNVWLSLEKDLNRTPQLIKLRYNEINSEIKAMKTFSGVEDACIIQKVQEMGKADEAIWINLERVLSRPANLIRRRWLHHLSKSIVLYEKQEAVSSMDYNSESPQGSVSDNDQLSTNYSSSVSSTRTKQNNSSTRKRSSGQY